MQSNERPRSRPNQRIHVFSAKKLPKITPLRRQSKFGWCRYQNQIWQQEGLAVQNRLLFWTRGASGRGSLIAPFLPQAPHSWKKGPLTMLSSVAVLGHWARAGWGWHVANEVDERLASLNAATFALNRRKHYFNALYFNHSGRNYIMKFIFIEFISWN